jgi:hypothetical protein
MPPLHEVLRFYLTSLLNWVPTLLALAAGVAVVSFSPLGRGLLRFLKERRHDAALNEEVLEELRQLRATLIEVTERLDSTERMLSIRADVQSFRRLPGPSQRPEVSTPH